MNHDRNELHFYEPITCLVFCLRTHHRYAWNSLCSSLFIPYSLHSNMYNLLCTRLPYHSLHYPYFLSVLSSFGEARILTLMQSNDVVRKEWFDCSRAIVTSKPGHAVRENTYIHLSFSPFILHARICCDFSRKHAGPTSVSAIFLFPRDSCIGSLV